MESGVDAGSDLVWLDFVAEITSREVTPIAATQTNPDSEHLVIVVATEKASNTIVWHEMRIANGSLTTMPTRCYDAATCPS